ncbi:MAG: ATP-binding protein [Ornithinimicrobium sp.]
MRKNFRLFSRGIRGRTTVSATLVVAIALLVASVALVVLQRQQLTAGLAAAARQQGDVVATQIEKGGLSAIDVTALSVTPGEPALLQVLDAGGRVLVSSDDDYEDEPIADLRPAVGESEQQNASRLPGETDEPFVVVASGVQTVDGPVVVVTAQSLETVERSTTVLLTLLVIGVPLVLLVVAATSYRVVGRALAPVEGIRARVAQVSVADQEARVPVPDSADEIEALANTMNSMLGRLQATAAAQHAFVADASHELRSPLATIRATTELARSHPEAMDPDTAAATVLTETSRLERLVADLLLLARSDEHGLVMRMGDVDFDDHVVGEKARLTHAGVQDVVMEVRAVRVTGDAQHLVRAVRNITDNAARYAATRVELRLAVVNGWVQLDVIDDGPGIPVADRERVFERFVRLDSSRERGTGGTGLGLAITREIARAHGGDVTVVTEGRGRGAHLRLTLPVETQED